MSYTKDECAEFAQDQQRDDNAEMQQAMDEHRQQADAAIYVVRVGLTTANCYERGFSYKEGRFV